MWAFDDSPASLVLAGRQATSSDRLHETARRIELAGAANETLSFRFAVATGQAPLEKSRLRVESLRSAEGASVPPDAAQLFRMQAVPVSTWPGWHIRSIPPHRREAAPLDILVPIDAPRGGLPETLAAGTRYDFWADLAIPRNTPEGVYTTDVEMLSGGAVVGAVTVQLTVWPIRLPDHAGVPVIAEVDHHALFRCHPRLPTTSNSEPESERAADLVQQRKDELLTSTLRLLQSHRLTPVLPELAPPAKVDAAGRLTLDWGEYDAVAEPCLTGRLFPNGAGAPVWPLPSAAVATVLKTVESPPMSDSYQLLGEYVRKCSQHFADNGWLDRTYVLPPGFASVEATRRLAATISDVNDRVQIASRLFPQNMAPYGWVDYPHTDVSDAVDIWIPPAQFFDPEAMAAQRAAGKATWLAVDRPPFSGSVSIHASSADARVLSWQALHLGAQAMLLGYVNRWPGAVDEPSPAVCVTADPNVLLYPGGSFGLEQPVQSVRLKYLRQSLQDAAYCSLLTERGLEHVVAALAQSLAPYGGSDAYRTHFADGKPAGWPGDSAAFETARRIMAEELMSRSKAEQPAPRELARNAAWRQFMLATRRFRVQPDGVRLRLAVTRHEPELHLDCALALSNGRRDPVGGTIRFGALSGGWLGMSSGIAVPVIPPNDSRRVTLSASAGFIPANLGGRLLLPVEFTSDAQEVWKTSARLSCLTAAPRTVPILVDGDLSDWPPGTTNVASGFVLITGAEMEAFPAYHEPADSMLDPSSSTLAFVLMDADCLYLAVNCEGIASQGETASRKSPRYDDLIPVGEELVEVLIDPLNAGTRSASDLYHIVVKRSGADLAERGVAFGPACGPRRPWPADIEVATRALRGRWMAEIRIPWEAFGPAPKNAAIWGFNITRFDAANQEFSTWSGAVGNAYDPLSLGNLYLP